MARIYVSSSWKNNFQQSLVEELRKRGHQVYDFRHSLADGKDECNVWKDVCQRLGLTRHRLSGTVLPGDFERMVSDDENLPVGGFSESGENRFQSYSHVLLHYGYTRRTMLRVISRLRIGYGNPKWGAPTDRKVFIIEHQNI